MLNQEKKDRVVARFTVLGSDAAKGTFVATLYDNKSKGSLDFGTTGISNPDLKKPETLKSLVDNALALSQRPGTDPVIEFIPDDWARENSMP